MCVCVVPHRFITMMNKNNIETVIRLSVKAKLPEIVTRLFVTGSVEARNTFSRFHSRYARAYRSEKS